jgi:WD40 repeat protein
MALSATNNLFDIFLLAVLWQHISWFVVIPFLSGIMIMMGIGFEWLARQKQWREEFYSYTNCYQLAAHKLQTRQLSWSPNGHWLASSFSMIDLNKADISLLNCQTRAVHRFSSASFPEILMPCLTWSQDGRILAFPGFDDANIHLFDTYTERIRSLDGQTGSVSALAFADEGRLLISLSTSSNTPISIWRVDTTERVSTFSQRGLRGNFAFYPGSRFFVHPKLAMFAVTGSVLALVWDIDTDVLLDRPLIRDTVHYANAKVVLVGDSGVGKSGLSLVLTDQHYRETDSSHARHVWTLSRHEVSLQKRQKEAREILLWDLAGQPGVSPTSFISTKL